MSKNTYIDVALGDQTYRLSPNTVLGSGPHCDLRLNSPEISSFHAAFTLRDGEWTLLALRGAIATNNKLKRCDEIRLGPGVTIYLPGGFSLVVRACAVGPQLRLVLRDQEGHELRPASRASLRLGASGQLELCSGHVEQALHLTAIEDGVFVQPTGGGAAEWIAFGSAHTLEWGGKTLRVETEEIPQTARSSAVLPVEIRLRRAQVEVRPRSSADPGRRASLSGKQSHLVQELVYQPELSMSRSSMCRRLWPAEVQRAEKDKAQWENMKLVLDARLAVLVSQTNAHIKKITGITRNLIVSQKRDLRLDMDPENYDLLDLEDDEGDSNGEDV